MKYLLVLAMLLSLTTLSAEELIDGQPQGDTPLSANDKECDCSNIIVPKPSACVCDDPILSVNKTIIISVVGQGVAPMNTDSPAQAYALAKRAAIADAYRLVAEKVKGVRVDGHDLIKNMMVKRTTVRTAVAALVRNANVIETSFKDGLCEVEMEIVLSYAQFI